MENLLNGTNNQIQMNSIPVQQPLNQNSDFFGYDSFKDFFQDWLDSTFGYKSHMNYGSTSLPDTYGDSKKLIGDQENRWLNMLGYHEDVPGSSPSSDKTESIYDDVYKWIQEAIQAGVNSANEQWLKTAKYNIEQVQAGREWDLWRENTYFQRRMEDLKKAGINPLLAFDALSGASTPTSSVASMSTYNTNSLYNGMMNSILGDKKIQAALLTVIGGLFSKLFGSSTSFLSALLA